MNRNRKLELMVGMLILIGFCLVFIKGNEMTDALSKEVSGNIIVLDAGHGGDDPGKVGINQALEKDINLAIAKKVQKLLEKDHITVVMTRKKDEMLCDRKSRNRKVQDLKKRLSIMNESNATLVVSIHQNSFHDSSCSGAQVFYHVQSVEGKNLATLMQEKMREEIDPENKREAKANDSYYLLKETTVPCIIVECGFLSNWKEASFLNDEDYQEKLAQTIKEGILTYLDNVNKNDKRNGK